MAITNVRVLYFKELSKECHVILTWNTGLEMDYVGSTHDVFEYIHAYQTIDTKVSFTKEA